MELRAYLTIIRKRRWVILSVALVIILGYSAFFFTQTPQYTASSRVMLRLPPEWEDMPAVSMPSWQTRVSLATSRPTLEETANRLSEEGLEISPGALEAGLDVRQVEGTDFVDLTYTANDPERVLEVLNTHTQVFLQHDKKNNREDIRAAFNNLNEELEWAREQLENTEDRLGQARTIQRREDRLEELRDSQQKLREEFGPKHPRREHIQDRVDTLESEINELLDQFQSTTQREDVPGLIRITPDRVQRQVDLNQRRVGQLQSDVDLLRFNMSLLERSASLVSNAEETYTRYPATGQTYGFVVLAGCILGISVGGFLEYLNDRIETKFDVHLYMDLPVLGSIPDTDEDSLNLIDNPIKSPLGERYNQISGLLQYSMLRDENQQSLLITSPQSGDGKSITTLNLGVSLARTGENVLIIDMDLRDPGIHELVNEMNSSGVSEVIGGESELDQLINQDPEQVREDNEDVAWQGIKDRIRTIGEDLPDVMLSGYLPMNPIQNLKSAYTDQLLRLVRNHYSIVLIDSPPITSVIDPIILSTKVDGVLMMVQAGEVRQGDAQHCKHLLEDVDAPLLGVILNRVRRELPTYYSYGDRTYTAEP